MTEPNYTDARRFVLEALGVQPGSIPPSEEENTAASYLLNRLYDGNGFLYICADHPDHHTIGIGERIYSKEERQVEAFELPSTPVLLRAIWLLIDEWIGELANGVVPAYEASDRTFGVCAFSAARQLSRYEVLLVAAALGDLTLDSAYVDSTVEEWDDLADAARQIRVRPFLQTLSFEPNGLADTLWKHWDKNGGRLVQKTEQEITDRVKMEVHISHFPGLEGGNRQEWLRAILEDAGRKFDEVTIFQGDGDWIVHYEGSRDSGQFVQRLLAPWTLQTEIEYLTEEVPVCPSCGARSWAVDCDVRTRAQVWVSEDDSKIYYDRANTQEEDEVLDVNHVQCNPCGLDVNTVSYMEIADRVGAIASKRYKEYDTPAVVITDYVSF